MKNDLAKGTLMIKQTIVWIAVALAFVLAGCGSVQPSTTATPRPSDIKAACEQVVLKFTDGKPVEFVEKIDENSDRWPEGLLGYYVFEDDIRQYVVDPDALWIRRMRKKPGSAWDELEASRQPCTREEAESGALEAFKKVMLDFLVEGGEVTAECTSPAESEGSYIIEVQERFNGIPTGNSAGIFVSKTGIFESGVFSKGDAEHIDKLINGKVEMISAETAQQIALESIKARPDMEAAENIQIDDNEPCELMPLEGTAVWAVRFTYTVIEQPDSPAAYGILVMVDAFSGEVVRFYFSA